MQTPATEAAAGGMPGGYAALRRTVAWGEAGPRGTLVAAGPDAVRFIDSFTTAAVAPLAVGSGTEGFFTDARGWVLALANIFRTAEGVWIDLAGSLAAPVAEHLERHHIRERLTLTDASAEFAHLWLAGPEAAAWLAGRCDVPPPEARLGHAAARLGDVPLTLVRIDSHGPVGFLVRVASADRPRLIAMLRSAAVTEAAPAAWETARIEAGVPDPHDIPVKTLPQELDRDARAISFTKGFYLGQETVARIDALGHVNRRLVAVAAAGWRPTAVPVTVHAGGDVVGALTSVAHSPTLGRGLGLGLLQTKPLAAGTPLTVEGREAVVVPVPLDVAVPFAGPGAGGDIDPDDDAQLLLETKRFRVVRVREPAAAGGPRHRDVVRHPGSVVIVPLVSPDQVCLVEVVRVAVGRTLLELPAGTLDRVESLEEAALRELAEETGYRAGRISAAGSMWMSPGILRERMHLFVAEDLVAGPQALEPGEQIRTRVVGWDEAVAMCLDGRIDDAKTIAGLLLTAARRAATPAARDARHRP